MHPTIYLPRWNPQSWGPCWKQIHTAHLETLGMIGKMAGWKSTKKEARGKIGTILNTWDSEVTLGSPYIETAIRPVSYGASQLPYSVSSPPNERLGVRKFNQLASCFPEAEAEGSQIQGQPETLSGALSQKKIESQACKPGTWEVEDQEFKVILSYVSIEASLSYIRSCLKNK